MPRVEIGRPRGLNIDLSPYELPNEVWSEGRNINFRNFRTSRELGYSQVFTNLTINPSFNIFWTDFDTPYWFYADDTSIYRTEGSSEVDVTRMSGAYTSDNWSGSVFNGALVMNNEEDAPQYFNTSSAKMEDLVGWQASTTASVVRPYKNYLVALDIKKGNTRFPTMVKWSDSADVGAVPPSWDEADPTTQAGENSLADSLGRCVDGRSLNDTFYIYKSDSVWAMQFIGGNFVFSFRKVFNDVGILAKDCVVEFDGRHFVVGLDDVYVHDGTSKKSVISNKVKGKLYGQINNLYTDRVRVVTDKTNKEIWIYYPSTDSTGLKDRVLVWNWEVDEWSERDIENISHISSGVIEPQEDDSWDNDTEVWDSDTTVWGESNFTPETTNLLMSDPVAGKFYQANLSTSLNGQPYECRVERIGIDFGDDESYKFVRSITPHFSGEGTVSIYVGTERNQGQGVSWSEPVSFSIGEDYKADFRESGRYVAVRFESPTDNAWSLTGYTIDFDVLGER